MDDSPSLSDKARHAIEDVNNLIVVSAAVVWEIRIKQAIGKLEIASEFLDIIKHYGFEILSITVDHAYAVGDLPMHHRDPFDRMIIAQAKLEGFTIVTHDPKFGKYGIPVIET